MKRVYKLLKGGSLMSVDSSPGSSPGSAMSTDSISDSASFSSGSSSDCKPITLENLDHLVKDGESYASVFSGSYGNVYVKDGRATKVVKLAKRPAQQPDESQTVLFCDAYFEYNGSVTRYEEGDFHDFLFCIRKGEFDGKFP